MVPIGNCTELSHETADVNNNQGDKLLQCCANAFIFGK